MMSEKKFNLLFLLILPALITPFGCGNSTPAVVTTGAAAIITGTGTLTLTSSTGSLFAAKNGTVQLTASGGTAPYTYSIVAPLAPYGGTINSSTGLYTAPGTGGLVQVGVQDTAGHFGYAGITVSSTGGGSGTQITLCNSASNCQSVLGLIRELNGQSYGAGQTNAAGACITRGKVFVSYQTSQHPIGCGYAYGLEDWNGSGFTETEYPICQVTSYVTVVSQIVCQ